MIVKNCIPYKMASNNGLVRFENVENYRVDFTNKGGIHLSRWQSDIKVFLEGKLKIIWQHFFLND